MGRASSTTRKRRDVIVAVLSEAPSPGLTLKELMVKLRELHAEGEWPAAEWAHARQDPYEVGVRQLIKPMVSAGEVYEKTSVYALGLVYSVPLRKHAQTALDLHEAGKTAKEIATELGISKTLVYSLLSDPSGAKERERKRGYCGSCGSPKEPDQDWCKKCVGTKAEALMPPQREAAFWQEAILRARTRGVDFLLGVTPDLRRVIRVDTGRGRLERVLRKNEDFEEVAREMELL